MGPRVVRLHRRLSECSKKRPAGHSSSAATLTNSHSRQSNMMGQQKKVRETEGSNRCLESCEQTLVIWCLLAYVQQTVLEVIPSD